VTWNSFSPKAYHVLSTRKRGTMPYYEYYCNTNEQTIEVRHGMNERLETWGELAERADVDTGTTPADTPIDKLLSAPIPLTGSSRDTGFQGCGSGCACASQN